MSNSRINVQLEGMVTSQHLCGHRWGEFCPKGTLVGAWYPLYTSKTPHSKTLQQVKTCKNTIVKNITMAITNYCEGWLWMKHDHLTANLKCSFHAVTGMRNIKFHTTPTLSLSYDLTCFGKNANHALLPNSLAYEPGTPGFASVTLVLCVLSPQHDIIWPGIPFPAQLFQILAVMCNKSLFMKKVDHSFNQGFVNPNMSATLPFVHPLHKLPFHKHSINLDKLKQPSGCMKALCSEPWAEELKAQGHTNEIN